MRRRPAFALCILGLLLFAGCHRANESAQPVSRTARFDALFAQHCSGCHGADGQFGPAVPLNDPLFLALMSDDALRRVISGGRELMPAFAASHQGPLTDEEIGLLISGIRAKWESKVDHDHLKEARAYLSSEQAPPAGDPRAGEQLFSDACAECHGSHGQGTSDEAGPLDDPNYLALVSDQLIQRMVITGRPDLEMPPYEKSDAVAKPFVNQVSDIVAYVTSWRQPAAREASVSRKSGSRTEQVAER